MVPDTTPQKFASPNVLVLTVAVYAMFLFSPRVLGDGDTFSHIATGEWMLAHRTIPRFDPFAFTTEGQVWVPHEWLAEIIMALAWRAGGWIGVVVLTASCAALAIAVMARLLDRHLRTLPTYILLILTVMTIVPTMLARPHILTLPIMTIWVAQLVSARAEKRAPQLWLAGLMVLWTNMHGSYMIGLAIAGALATEAVVSAWPDWWAVARGWALFMVLAVLAACATPLGLDGILFPFQMLGRGATAHIQEWVAPNFQEPQPLEFILMATLLFGLTSGVRLPWFRVLLFLGLLHSALRHTRFQMQLAVIGFQLLAPALGAWLPPRRADSGGGKWPGRVMLAALIFVTVARFSQPIVRGDDATAPVTALAAVPVDVRSRPVFSAYEFGGYLIFQGVRPYVDGRADLFGDAFLDDYLAILQAKPSALNAAFAKFNIGWTILAPDVPLVAWLDTQPGWRRLHADGTAVVHVRN